MPKPKSIRVFIDLSKLKYPNTGLATVCTGFLQALAKQDLNGLELHLLVPKFYIAKYRQQWGDKFCYLPYFFGYKLYFYWYKYSLIHIPHQDFSVRCIPSKIPLLLCVHDLNFLVEKTGRRRQWYLTRLQRNVDRAARITTISEATRKVMREKLRLSLPISVIYNGIQRLQDLSPAPIDRLPKNFILSIGVTYPKKRFEYLIRMLACLPEHIHLIIIGSGKSAYRSFLSREVQQLGLNSRIFFAELLSEAEKLSYLQRCMAYMSASQAEGFALPILEAFSCGKPVFLSKIAAHMEIGADLAYYFDSLAPQAMANLFLNRMQKELSTQKDERVGYAKKFSWEHNAQKYLEIYRAYI